jgi:argininosuccinate lyase
VKSRSRKRQPTREAGQSEKLWGGRFTRGADPRAERFTGSLAFDRRLWPHDITGSVAWAKALAKAGLLSATERDAIVRGLRVVRAELEAGTFPFRAELEDIHTNVERRLQELIGDVGGKLHTGRSRNDQIAVDERLYLRETIATVRAGLRATQEALATRAAEALDSPLPGYTHLQRAQPVVLGHHLLAYVFMLQRDRNRFGDCATRADTLPLGAAALAGTAFPIDLEALA